MEAELSVVLSSKSFAKSTRLKRILEYIVNRSLAGDVGALKEYTLGLEVFDRGASFDPSSDPIVRVEASRLRRRLYAYYATEGAANAFQIHIPRGAYVAAVRARQAELSANTLTAKSEVNAIMVLPFSTYEHYPNRPYAHARILSDHLIHLLTQSSQVRVVSRFSSTQIDPNMDVRALGDCFGAQLVVEGSILDAEDQYQILTYLVEVTQGYNLWSGHYQAGHDVLFSVAHEIAADLISGIQGLGVNSMGEGRRMAET
jgi:serine/threonine-protein kinase